MPDPWGGDRPDEQGVEELTQHLRRVWQQVRTDMARMDSFRLGTFDVWDDKRPGYHPPTARYIIDHAVDTQMSVDPKIKKFPAGDGEKHKARADRVEPALTAVLMDAVMKEPSIPWRQAYSYLLQYGYCVMGVLWEEGDKGLEPRRRDGESDEDYEGRVSQYEAGKAGWNPVRIKAPHPARVLMDPFEMQPSVAIIEAKRYAQELERLTKGKARYVGKRVESYRVQGDPYGLVDTLEIWTKAWHLLKLSGGQLLVMERNPFGFMPYCHGFAGWGGEITDPVDADPRHMAVGMLAGVLELMRVQAQKASAVHNAVIERGFARMGTIRNSEEAAQQLERGAEALLQGEKEDYWWLEYPEIRQWVFESQQQDDRELESATYIRALSGERQQGVTTVGQQMILTQAANRKFFIPAKQIERMATILAGWVLRMVSVRGEPITLRGSKLTAQDIEGSYDVHVSFQQFDPLVQMDMRRLGMEEVARNLKSDETYRESDAMIENEAEERKRLLLQEVRRMPEVHREMVLAALKEEGFKALADRMKAAVAAPPNGAVPGA